MKLDKCIELRHQIIRIQENIECLRTRLYSPKSQIITGMPTGSGGVTSSFEDLIDKIIILEQKERLIYNELDNLWNECVNDMRMCNINTNYIHLMNMRFYQALSWKQCVAKMNFWSGENWNENKAFRVYKDVKRKLLAMKKEIKK